MERTFCQILRPDSTDIKERLRRFGYHFDCNCSKEFLFVVIPGHINKDDAMHRLRTYNCFPTGVVIHN